MAGKYFPYICNMKVLFLCYDKCSTCKKALKWLSEHNIEVNIRSITEDHPTYEELSVWLEQSGLEIRRFFNTSGMKYRELGLKDRVSSESKEELLRLLSSDGMLVKRPLIVWEKGILLGFREEEYQKALL